MATNSTHRRTWVDETLKLLEEELSPTSLKVTIELMRRIRDEDLQLHEVSRFFWGLTPMFNFKTGSCFAMLGDAVGLPFSTEILFPPCTFGFHLFTDGFTL